MTIHSVLFILIPQDYQSTLSNLFTWSYLIYVPLHSLVLKYRFQCQSSETFTIKRRLPNTYCTI